jgi:hypothetical protein
MQVASYSASKLVADFQISGQDKMYMVIKGKVRAVNNEEAR